MKRHAILFLISYSLIAVIFIFSRGLELSECDVGVIQGFIEWFGVLYGLLLAMIVVEVWQKYNLINNEIDKEADALYLLVKTAGYAKNTVQHQNLLRIIHDYAAFVSQTKNGYENSAEKTNGHLKKLYDCVGEIVCGLKSDAIATELIHRVNEVVDTRGDWIARTKEHISNQLWILLIIASCVWLLSFFGLKIQSIWIALVIVGSSVFVVTALLSFAADLDNPKTGLWTPNFDSFDLVLEETSKLLNKSGGGTTH
ncbi:DUF4239 domain-containing protein [candidate division KSB1 bacterium]|nr:DUF4239 domain-containing protein [candidate division KSB1 bacterium]